MRESWATKIQRPWALLTTIGVIAAVGFNVAIYFTRFESVADASTAHKAIEERIAAHDRQIQDIRFVNVRIEVSQKQILDRLELMDERVGYSRAYPDLERQQRIHEIEERVRLRGAALNRSFEERPAVPHAMAGDPLVGLDNL